MLFESPISSQHCFAKLKVLEELKIVWKLILYLRTYQPVWPDWEIFCTLGNFSKPVATIIFSKIATF